MEQQEASQGSEKFTENLRSQLDAMTSLGVSLSRQSKEYPEFLYHYTDTNALMGMVDNNELWATNSSYLNDDSELAWAHRVFSEIIDAMPANNADEAELFRRMKQAANAADPSSDIYLCSFAEELDDLTQWGRYGKGQGPVCIGFRSEKIASKFVGCELISVIYERTEQIEIAKALVDMVINFYRRQISKALSEITFDYISHCTIAFRRMVTYASLRFKGSHWKSEKEWRLVTRKEISRSAVAFRSGVIGMTPYLKLKPTTVFGSSYDMPITSVMVGPTQHRKLASDAVRMYAADRHFMPWSEVSVSQATVR